MAMARRLADLREMSDEQLIDAHDKLAQNTQIGIDYYLDELRRRESARLASRVYWLTWVLVVLTAVIAVLTLVLLAAE